MERRFYEEHLRLAELGLRRESADALRSFINSIADDTERETWVREYLKNLGSDKYLKIRNELFEEVIFPVLYKGYGAKDIDSTLWLGRLAQNIYRNERISRALEFKSELALYKECYELEPARTDVQELLLACQLEFFSYSIHEWPAGILYGINGANAQECAEIRKDLEFAQLLDKRGVHQAFFDEYEKKLNEYERRIGNPHGVMDEITDKP